MTTALLADGVLLLHFLFILFAIFGGALVLFRRRWLWLHLPVVLWAGWVNLASWTCPLTPLENQWRIAAGQAGYSGGFIEHYITPLVYPYGMSRSLELTAGIAIILWNIFVYSIVWLRRRRER